jgi:hypothetical protein
MTDAGVLLNSEIDPSEFLITLAGVGLARLEAARFHDSSLAPASSRFLLDLGQKARAEPPSTQMLGQENISRNQSPSFVRPKGRPISFRTHRITRLRSTPDHPLRWFLHYTCTGRQPAPLPARHSKADPEFLHREHADRTYFVTSGCEVGGRCPGIELGPRTSLQDPRRNVARFLTLPDGLAFTI